MHALSFLRHCTERAWAPAVSRRRQNPTHVEPTQNPLCKTACDISPQVRSGTSRVKQSKANSQTSFWYEDFQASTLLPLDLIISPTIEAQQPSSRELTAKAPKRLLGHLWGCSRPSEARKVSKPHYNVTHGPVPLI
jgi:hypothetical protein